MKKNLIVLFVKNTAFIGAIYFGTALAIQINSGGDVEYWLSLFVGLGILIASSLEWAEKKGQN